MLPLCELVRVPELAGLFLRVWGPPRQVAYLLPIPRSSLLFQEHWGQPCHLGMWSFLASSWGISSFDNVPCGCSDTERFHL